MAALAEAPAPAELGLRALFSLLQESDSEDDDERSLVERWCRVVDDMLELRGVRVKMSPRRQALGVFSEESGLTESESETGAVVWDSAVFLGRRLRLEEVRGRKCLELGAGCGLLGLICCRLGASEVLLTDRAHRLKALEENRRLDNGGENCRVLEVDWRRQNLDFFLHNGPFDLVLGADVIYDLPLIVPLVETLRKALVVKGKAMIAVDESIGKTASYEAFDLRCKYTFATVDVERKGRFRLWTLSRPLPTAIVVFGVCGAGKSTLASQVAKKLGAGFIDADDLHPPENRAKMARGQALTDDDRRGWLHACAKKLLEEVATASPSASPQIVVLACSALRQTYRQQIAEALRFRIRLVGLFLEASVDLVKARVQNRPGHFMPVTLVASQFAALEAPTPTEPAFGPGGILLRVDAASPTDDQIRALLDSGAL